MNFLIHLQLLNQALKRDGHVGGAVVYGGEYGESLGTLQRPPDNRLAAGAFIHWIHRLKGEFWRIDRVKLGSFWQKRHICLLFRDSSCKRYPSCPDHLQPVGASKLMQCSSAPGVGVTFVAVE
jgi:hypothetical protein